MVLMQLVPCSCFHSLTMHVALPVPMFLPCTVSISVLFLSGFSLGFQFPSIVVLRTLLSDLWV